MNLMLIETNGTIIENYLKTGTYAAPASIVDLAEGHTHREFKWIGLKTSYRYEVNQKIYENNKISNVIVFPEIKQNDRIINVYYNRFINRYSVLFKCNFKYFLINSIPLYIIILLIIYYKKRNLKNIKWKDIIKYYFRIDKKAYLKYNIK